MRYRLMASYLGASYQAAVGPSDRDVTLFAAPPPPEEHGFAPATSGIWLKQVRLDDLEGLWESRPIGSYHGEPCLVLDDLGDRLHIVYLGMDGQRAAQLGYWEVDRGVFEVVVPRYEVTDLAEERHEFPIPLLLAALPAPAPRALGPGAPSPAAGPLPIAGPGGTMPQGPGGMPQPGQQGGAMPAAAGTQGPGGMQQPAPPAMPNVQQPAAGAYYPQPGAMSNGTGLPMPQGMPAGPSGPGGPGGAQFAPGMQAAQQPGTPAAQPAQAGPPQAMPQPAAQQQYAPPPAPAPMSGQQPQGPQSAAPQQPTAMPAWYGSPAPDGNGQWYYQQAQDAARNGGTAPPQYPQAPAAGYQQAPQAQPGAAMQQQVPSAQQQQPLAQQQLPAAQQPQQAALGGMQAQNVQQPQAAPAAAQQPPAQYAVPQPQALAPQAQAPAPAIAQPGPVTAPLPATAPAPPQPVPSPPAALQQVRPEPAQPLSAPVAAPAETAPPPAHAGGEQTAKSSGVRGRRAARKPRLSMSAIFADLVDMADIPRTAYAVDEEVTGAMCLFKTDGGYEVFSCGEDARHEVRFFEEEESAYFYLFGVLTAEAVRSGRLTPRNGAAPQTAPRQL